VALEDFVHVVVNEDTSQLPPEGLERTTREMRAEAGKRGIHVLILNAQSPATVHGGLMEPLLRHLAERLAVMDRAATHAVLTSAREVAGKLAALAETVTQRLSGWQAAMPDQVDELHARAERLRDDLATPLATITDHYVADAAAGKTDAALEAAVRSAASQARDWAKGGLGVGSRAGWLTRHLGRHISHPYEAREREYATARAKIGELFGHIDASVDASVDRLCGEIADALRTQLTEAIVPAGDNGATTLARLRDTAVARRGRVLPEALRELVSLLEAYGSTLLRVTRPIVRTITVSPGGVSAASATSAAESPSATSNTHADVMARLRRSSAAHGQPSARLSAESTRPVREPATASAGTRGVGDGHSQVAGAQREAEGLYDELTSLVLNRIDELEKALLAEGSVMFTVLAAATDRFLDLAVKTPKIELEYKKLCDPVQRRLWPDIFDGGQAQLEAGLVDLESAASSLASAVAAVRQLDQ
jgi:hypothetical protein